MSIFQCRDPVDSSAALRLRPPPPVTPAGAAGWVLVFVCFAGLLQLLMPNFFDGDTGYHLAVARLTRERGILHAFPWTPFSWLAEHYADKEFLFHMLLVPVANLDPNAAARIAGTVLGALLLTTLFVLLVKERVPDAGAWTLLAMVSSTAFVARFAMVRPHLLSIPLALAVTWAASRQRRTVLAVAAFLYPLCYTAWHLPVVLMGIAGLAGLLSGRGLDWRTPLVGGAALLAGIAVHPNFPENVALFWIQNVNVLLATAWSGRSGFDLGGEFEPFTPLGLLRYVALPGLLAALALVPAWRSRRRDPLPLAAALVALAFLALTLRTQRFIEYLAPFAALAAALAWHLPRRRARPEEGGLALAPMALLLALLLALLVGRHPIELLRSRVDPFPDPVPEILARIVPQGAQIVTCDWRLTGEMMLALPERRFLVALDPVFFDMNDPERYRIWFETVHDPPERPAILLRDTFDARYVLCDHREQWRPFREALARDPDSALRGVVGFWWVYELRPRELDPLGRRLSSR